MPSRRKGVSPLISVALLLVLVVIASTVLSNNLKAQSFVPYDDEDKNRLMEKIEIVDVLEKDYVDLGITTVTVYVMNKGPINANLSAMYMSDMSGNILQANLSLDKYIRPGEIVGLTFTKPITINWTAFLAVTTRGNIAYYLYDADNERLPDYVYSLGYMIGYDLVPIPVGEPPYVIVSVPDETGGGEEPITPEELLSYLNSSFPSDHFKIQVTGGKLMLNLNDKNTNFAEVRFQMITLNEFINLSLVQDPNFNGDYVNVSFYNFNTDTYDFFLKIMKSELTQGDPVPIIVNPPGNYLRDDGLFIVQFTVYGKNFNFHLNVILDNGTTAYNFNAEYAVTLSDPDPSLTYVRGVLFDLTGTANIPGDYSLWLYNYTSGEYDLQLEVSNSTGTYDAMFLSETDSRYYAFYQGNLLDYLNSNYELKYMILPEENLNEYLSLSFSAMYVQLFIEIPQQRIYS